MSHPIETRIKAAIAWLLTGSISEAAKISEVPERTLRYWMDQPSWEQILDNAKAVKDQELDAMWTSLIHQCTDQIKDRVLNGDVVLKQAKTTYTDGGKSVTKGQWVEVRVPISLKDLTVVTAIAVDKRSLVRKSTPKGLEGKTPKGANLEDISKGLEEAGADSGPERAH